VNHIGAKLIKDLSHRWCGDGYRKSPQRDEGARHHGEPEVTWALPCGGNNQRLVTPALQGFQYFEDRVGDTVHGGKKRFCDKCNPQLHAVARNFSRPTAL